MKGMQSIRRGRGSLKSIRALLRYQFANKNASLICTSNVLISKDADGLTREIFDVCRTIRPDVIRPIWHQALRLPPGEEITHERFREIAQEYMRRMGFGPSHQWGAIVSDDPKGQHIHIFANRISIDGSLYLGKNENLKSTRITQELEAKFGLHATAGPATTMRADGKVKVAMPRERRAKRNELEMHDRLAHEGKAQPMARKAILKVLRAALFAGQASGLGAFLSVAEGAGIAVKANVANTGKVNGLSFMAGDGIAFKASQLGDAYSWTKLSAALRYQPERDLALLKARSHRAKGADARTSRGQPAPAISILPAPPANGLRPSAANGGGNYTRLTRNPNLLAAAHRRLAAQIEAEGDARDHLIEQAQAQAKVVARVQEEAEAAVAAKSLQIAKSAARAQVAAAAASLALVPNFVFGFGVAISPSGNLDEALRGFANKPGRWGKLYIRTRDGVFALLETSNKISFREIDDETLRAGLALAAAKWSLLKLHGSGDFKRRAMLVAISMGIGDRIGNPELKAMRQPSLKAAEDVTIPAKPATQSTRLTNTMKFRARP